MKVVDYPAYDEVIDYILQVRVLRMEEWDEEKDWFAVIEMNATLEEVKTGHTIFNELFSAKKSILERTPHAVVTTLNAVLKECSEQLLKTIEDLQ